MKNDVALNTDGSGAYGSSTSKQGVSSRADIANSTENAPVSSPEMLSEEKIRSFLLPETPVPGISVFESVTSTNTLARELAENGEPEGSAVIAGSQTSGRGRMGRSFFSPDATGLYISLILRPSGGVGGATHITTMAAVAVCEAIEAVSKSITGIKWVNDIFINGKKVCGILTEGSASESGGLEYAVLGVGINLFEPDGGFPDELSGIAGAVFQQPAGNVKNRLAADFLNRFFSIYNSPDGNGYAEKYRKRSLVIGKSVTLVRGGVSKPALVLDIDADCRLLVQYPDGSRELCGSGEISVKL